MTDPVAITPETKVAELLEAYPELEDVLVAIAPMFAKLKNPVLRRTIARVTTLERAASVAGLSPRDLVGQLREAVGLSVEHTGSESDAQKVDFDPADLPEWVDPERVQWTVDADELLEIGGQPVAEVQKRAMALEAGNIGLVTCSFRPAPLLDLLENKGFRTAVTRSESGFSVYVGLSLELAESDKDVV
ncbi:MAG: DUF1858 domain-containing protein [bacterium]|nr:DUF1858 domain-containing protein [bacterium]